MEKEQSERVRNLKTRDAEKHRKARDTERERKKKREIETGYGKKTQTEKKRDTEMLFGPLLTSSEGVVEIVEMMGQMSKSGALKHFGPRDRFSRNNKNQIKSLGSLRKCGQRYLSESFTELSKLFLNFPLRFYFN